jgi:hypothetical protein
VVDESNRDPLVEREVEAARASAGRIGGRRPADVDPAQEAVIEAGGGDAEGFEQAEAELRERAEHGEAGPAFDAQTGTPTSEDDRQTVVYGEADEIDTTEVVRDPHEGPDDPGAGPGIAAER